jgi:undecaprenyl-diphosphatase
MATPHLGFVITPSLPVDGVLHSAIISAWVTDACTPTAEATIQGGWPMNPDYIVTSYVNHFARRSWAFDSLVAFVSTNDLLKGCLLAAVVWGLWFQAASDPHVRRERIVATILACFIALFLARIMAAVLPFRPRPMSETALNFQLPYEADRRPLETTSSFPSDHAVLFFTLATGIWFVSRQIGWPILGYVLIVICFPRLYLGLHYLSDLLVGGLIGAGLATLANDRRVRPWISAPALQWVDTSPGVFYAFAFLITGQIANLFEPLRKAASFAFTYCSSLLG